MKNNLNCIHVYYNIGRGKTSIATGMVIRAVGAGKKVVFAQFLKGSESSEIGVLKTLPGVTVLRNQKNLGFTFQMSAEELEEVKKMHDSTLKKIEAILAEEQIDLLVLDELNATFDMNLIDRNRIRELIGKKPCEIVITGVNRIEEFIEQADYVTNLMMEKHPYEKGIQARKGIEF